ncbi:MAG TPA: GDSL-type esterase/lipase family protein [bacterium]
MKKNIAKNLRADSLRNQHELNPKRRRLFVLIMLFIPLLFILILELILQIAGYGINTDLFIPAQGDYSDYFKINPLVGHRFFMSQVNVPNPPNDLFLINKPENGFRIFVMGGSTTAGYPYGNNLMFSRILNQRLSDAFPEKHIEVINTATVAINSYALLDFMDEIFEKQPDAILIYAGHNEFYGALGVASTETLGRFRPILKLYLKLKRFKTPQLFRDILWQLKNRIASLANQDDGIKPSATLMERLVAEQNIPYHSPVYKAGKIQYQENLRDLLKKAQHAKIPVIISELVSNVADQQPFLSMPSDSYPAAIQVYQTAKILEEQNNYEAAKEKYYLAKDFDALRFRAPEEFNEIIHQVAKESDAIVVPMKSFFESASPGGIPGKELFLEHLHPNIDGYFIMADAFFETMRNNRMILPHWLDYKITPASYYRTTWGLTPLDSLYGELRIRILQGGWPFKPKSAPNRAIIDYVPATKAESLAVKVWSQLDYTLERGHVEMAEYYEKIKRYNLAYAEYQALICLTPLNVSPYLKAADMLIKGGNFRSALILLKKSLTLAESFFANKWIGQILLNFNEVKESIPYLEKAHEQDPGDPQLLYSLSGAYALSAQYRQARELLSELYKIVPDFHDPYNLRNQLDRMLSK